MKPEKLAERDFNSAKGLGNREIFFPSCMDGAKEPLPSRRRFRQGFPKNVLDFEPEKTVKYLSEASAKRQIQ